MATSHSSPEAQAAKALRELAAFRKMYAGAAPRAALAALRALDRANLALPEWQIEHARLLRLSGKLDRAETILSRVALPGDPDFVAEYAAVLAAKGAHYKAVELVAAALKDDPENTQLTRVMAGLKVAGPATPPPVGPQASAGVNFSTARRITRRANRLTDAGAPGAAFALAKGASPEDGPGAAIVNLAAARAASARDDSTGARDALVRGILQITPDSVFNHVKSALVEIALPDRPRTAVDSILAGLRGAEAASAAISEQLILTEDDFARLAPPEKITAVCEGKAPEHLLTVLHTLKVKGDTVALRDVAKSPRAFDGASARVIEQAIHYTSGLGDAELVARLSALVLERDTFEPLDPKALVLRAAVAASTGEVAPVARDLLSCEQQGRLTAKLAFYLSLKGEGLAATIEDNALREEFARLVPKSRGLLQGFASMVAVERERAATTLLMRALGRAPDQLVSVITPIHRAIDLPRLRENLLAQTWPHIEAIILPNGPLARAPEVANALGDLPFVRIVHSEKQTIGGLLNDGIDVATGAYVLRFDSDDIYLPDYITNTVSLLHATGADHCSKSSLFISVEAAGIVLLKSVRFPLVRFVGGTGGSHAFRAEVLQSHRYPEAVALSEDILFCRELVSAGRRVIDAPPFDMVITRRAEKSHHTWQLDDVHLFGDHQFLGTSAVIPSLGHPVFE